MKAKYVLIKIIHSKKCFHKNRGYILLFKVMVICMMSVMMITMTINIHTVAVVVLMNPNGCCYWGRLPFFITLCILKLDGLYLYLL